MSTSKLGISKESVSKVTGHVCSHKGAFFLDNLIRRVFQSPQKIVGPHISPGDTVVDIGCGPGFFSLEMAKLVGPGGRVVAVDLQREMLAKVEAKARAQNLSQVMQFHRCSQLQLGLPAITADFILAFYMVHETRDYDAFFSQVWPHLKAGGRFLIVEPPFMCRQVSSTGSPGPQRAADFS